MKKSKAVFFSCLLHIATLLTAVAAAPLELKHPAPTRIPAGAQGAVKTALSDVMKTGQEHLALSLTPISSQSDDQITESWWGFEKENELLVTDQDRLDGVTIKKEQTVLLPHLDLNAEAPRDVDLYFGHFSQTVLGASGPLAETNRFVGIFNLEFGSSGDILEMSWITAFYPDPDSAPQKFAHVTCKRDNRSHRWLEHASWADGQDLAKKQQTLCDDVLRAVETSDPAIPFYYTAKIFLDKGREAGANPTPASQAKLELPRLVPWLESGLSFDRQAGSLGH